MATKVINADVARYDAMDALTNVSSIGGGAGSTVETDIYYQNAAAISRKVTGAGFYTSTGTARNMTTTGRRVWLVKGFVTNYGGLTNYEIRIGSATTAYYTYTIATNTTPLYPARGGWLFIPIDPNIAGYRDATTGSPSLTAVNYFGTFLNCSTSKAENLVMDAVDVGVGMYLTNGDGADADGLFSDFVTADQGTATTGRWGFVREIDGILYIIGKLTIGASTSSGTRTTTATGFTDSNVTLVWPTGRFENGFASIDFDIGNASTDINVDNCTFISRGTNGTTDTRVTMSIFGTSGTLDIGNSTFINFDSFATTTKANFTGCVFNDCNEITGNAFFDSCTFNGHTTATGVAYISTNDLTTIENCTFDNTGGTGHAIVITATGTYNFVGNQFIGYGATGSTNAAIYNNSGGSVTINITGGGGTPTYRNGTGASTTINNAVTLTVSNVILDSEIRIFTDDGSRTELAGTETVANGTLTAVQIAGGGTGYTVNDVLTLSGGTFTTAAQVTVTSVSSGVITGVSITNPGSGYSVAPTNPVSVTGGTGSGATFTATIRGSLTYSYNYTSATPVIIVVFHLSYKDIWLTGQSLKNENQTIPVQQIIDRVYLNPA